LPKCQFTSEYYDYEIKNSVDFYCDDEEALSSGFCIFHDKHYLQDKINNEEHKRNVLEKLKHKVDRALSYSEPLLCIGFQLPEFSLSDLSNNLSNSKEFTKPVYFSGSHFYEKADFARANFEGGASFYNTKFEGETLFYNANFRVAIFTKANFEREAKLLRGSFSKWSILL